MSIQSYTSYECSFPKGTSLLGPLHVWQLDSHVWNHRSVEYGDVVTLRFEGETGYSDFVLDDLVGLFDRPLDEVPGLKLDLHYETTDVDEGFFGCDLHIEDGKCHYEESYIAYRELPMDDCPIKIGRTA